MIKDEPKATGGYMFVVWIRIRRIFTVTLKGVIYKRPFVISYSKRGIA